MHECQYTINITLKAQKNAPVLRVSNVDGPVEHAEALMAHTNMKKLTGHRHG